MPKPLWQLTALLHNGLSLANEETSALRVKDRQQLLREALLASRFDEFERLLNEWKNLDGHDVSSVAYQVGSLKREPRYLEAILSNLSATQLRKIDMYLISHYANIDRLDLLACILNATRIGKQIKRDAAGAMLFAAGKSNISVVRALLQAGASTSRERLSEINDALGSNKFDLQQALLVIDSIKREMTLSAAAKTSVPVMPIRARL